jgi:multidrug efflux pump subunit AcrA (membrane-fusion protein)
MKIVLRIGGILLILALIGGGALFLLRPDRPTTAEAAPLTAAVTVGNIEETISATGNVATERQITLAFASSGQIAVVLVAKGQNVQAGDVLACLDTASLEWQVARAQASLDSAQARLEQAQQPATQEEIASAKAALDSSIASRE